MQYGLIYKGERSYSKTQQFAGKNPQLSHWYPRKYKKSPQEFVLVQHG